MKLEINSFYAFDFVIEQVGQIILSVTFKDWKVIEENDYDPDAFTLYVHYDLQSKAYMETEICEGGEPIPYSLTKEEEQQVLHYIEEHGLARDLFATDALYQRIEEAFNSEKVNELITQLKQCNFRKKKELLHVMEVSCDLKDSKNRDLKKLYEDVKHLVPSL